MQETDFRQAIGSRRGGLPHPRCGIYRNNVGMGLATALAVRHPMLQRLVGEAGFLRLAADFVAAGYLPQSPMLIDYGRELPEFCAGHAVGQEFPFIADLAELESRWWQAYHAADAEPLAAAAFADCAQDIENLRFRFHPSASLLFARWPAGSIWQALQRGEAIAAAAPLPQSIFIWRPQADVRVEIVSPQRAAFLSRLLAGDGLSSAVDAAMDADPGFDLQSEFQALIIAQFVTRIDRTA